MLKFERIISEHPVSSMLVALGCGAILGSAFSTLTFVRGAVFLASNYLKKNDDLINDDEKVATIH